jgi:predicted ATP-grasp superfamily ATP-dependent carboligase
MSETQPLRIDREAAADAPALIVGWTEDAADLGSGVIDYLTARLGAEELGEIEPEGFFPLGGVAVAGNVARFPESKFYRCAGKGLVVFKSNPPRSEWFRFLNLILDVAEQCGAGEVYTVGGMVYLGAHTFPRELMALSNSAQMKGRMAGYGLAADIDYESPPGQRPTLNSFLLWAAGRRNIGAASLWVPVPFYLVGARDPLAWQKVIEFLDERFDLGIDLSGIDDEAAAHGARMAELRNGSANIDSYIRKLEGGLGLSPEESEELVRAVEDFLGAG